MISVDEALGIVLDSVSQLESETVGIKDSYDRVLAEDLYSDCDIPAFDYSAMDGYAIRYADTAGASEDSPVYLDVVGEVKAGDVPVTGVERGRAVKIMTGAPIPEGADSVIMVEYTRAEGDRVAILREAGEGDNIRRAGEDVRRNDLVIRRGTRLGPAHLGMLASLGRTEVKVARMPRVAVIVTGDEVIMPDEEMGAGKVRNANAFSLCGQIIKAGAIPVDMGIVGDDIDMLRMRIGAALDSDVIITSGGVSMGDYDLVKDVLPEFGFERLFHKVAMRPGKPNLYGIINGRPVFGLPGNPVSCMVGFEVFVRPAILRMLGQGVDDRMEVDAYLEEDVKKRKGLRFFIRAVTEWRGGRFVTRTTGPQGSGILSSMVRANSLMILPEDVESLRKGSIVRVRFI